MDFEVKHLICAGLDVHKKTVVAAVCITDPVTLEATYKVKSFSTNNSQIAAMRDWLLSYNCLHVCMESTGKYWIPVFNILEPHMHVILTHPKYVKAIKGKKTDKRDAKWIANLFRFDIVKASFIPPADIRALRELSRYRLKLSYMRSAEKNRYQNSMTISRIRIDCVLTDPFGKTASSIMNYLLSDVPFDEKECAKLIHGGIKVSNEEIFDSIRGFEILSEQRFKMSQSKIGSKRSLETKSKMSDTAKRISSWVRMKPFVEKKMCPIVDSQGNQFRSLAEAAKFWSVSVSTVCDILKGRHTKTRKKISFRYLEVA